MEMNEFMIKFASAEGALSEMKQVESAIRSNGEDISRIRSGFRAEFGGKTRILQNLRGQIEKMSDLGDSMKTFESSLESILGLYNAVEQNLLGQLEEQKKTGTGGSESSVPVETVTDQDVVVDRIDNAGKEDERDGLIPGATIIGGLTLGTAASGGAGSGAGGGQSRTQTQETDGQAQGESGSSDYEKLESIKADFGIIYPSDELIRKISGSDIPKDGSWEDFLGMLPQDLIEKLPEMALEYLNNLFEMLKSSPMPFGEVFFPGMDNFINCGIWSTFYTLIMWYYYQRGLIGGEETAAGESGSESGDTESGTGDSENDSSDSKSGTGDSGNEEADGSGAENTDASNEDDADAFKTNSYKEDSSKTAENVMKDANPTGDEAAKASAKENAKSSAQSNSDQETGKSSGTSGGGSGSGGHSGGSGGGSGSGSGGGSSYSGEPAIDIPEAEDLTKDYVSSLVGDSGADSANAADWARGTMDNWGQKAAGELAGSSAAAASAAAGSAGSGSSAIGRTARSVVCAAVINAGIDLVMHGAGAVGSILGDGDKDVFPDMDSTELL